MQAKGTKELALAFESQMATQEKEEKVDQRAPTEAEFATAVRELARMAKCTENYLMARDGGEKLAQANSKMDAYANGR